MKKTDNKTMSKTGRPKTEIKEAELRAILRLKPTLEDCAAFFECSVDTIIRHIKENYEMSFANFRDENMVHTRFSLIRTAIQKAEKGDNIMLIFCLKNLCGWSDKQEVSVDAIKPIKLQYNLEDEKKDEPEKS